MPEESVKRIEQVGKAYETLKKKYARLAERIAEGLPACFDSDESQDEEEKKEGASGGSDEADEEEDKTDNARREEFEKKRKQKTKE